MELATYDWYLRLKPKTSVSNSRIILIAISENDISNLGRWPLPDATLAQLLGILIQHQPRAIGLDIYRDVSVPPGRNEFDEILTSNTNIITVMTFGETGVPPPPALSNTNQAGFNDMLVDPGGVVRRGLLFMDDGETVAYSFALRLALLYLQVEGIIPQPDPSNPEYIRLGQTTIRPFQSTDGGYVDADARGYQFLLDFRDVRGSFPSFSLSALLSGEIDPETFRDKIVLVGVTAQSVKDFFYTPFSRGLQADQQVAGIELHAHLTNQLLRCALEGSSTVNVFSEWEENSWILLWGIMGGAIGLRLYGPWRFSLLGTGGVLILGLLAYPALLGGWWIPVVPPAMTWLLSATVVTAYMTNQEKRQRAVLMRLFSSHVSPEIAEVIWQQREHILERGRPKSQRLIATVFFTDLQGYTSVSEKMDPQALIDWLNTYMESMAEVVMAHGGVVDDYAGDGVKANFGVPLPRTGEKEFRQDAVNAVTCALTMERELKRLNELLRSQRLPSVGLRIGMCTGTVVAGSVGSKQRLKYTTVGDTVNTASRLENLGKDLIDLEATESPCSIVISETTLRYLENKFKTQWVGEVSLKGKDEKINAYRVLHKEEKTANPNIQEK
jgi:adenylate cyclase